MNILFVCTWNVQRSKTAEDVFKDLTKGIPGFSIKSAGTAAKPSMGGVQLTKVHMQWADKVFVMEEAHVRFIEDNFPAYAEKVINLDIADDYYRDDPDLVRQLNAKLKIFLKTITN